MLKGLYIFLLVSYVFGEVVRYQFDNGAAITLFEVVLSIVWLTWAISRWKKRKETQGHFLFKPAGIFLGICIFSLLFALRYLQLGEFFISFLYNIRLIFFLSIIFISAEFEGIFKEKILKVLYGVGLVVVIEGYFQFIFYQNLRNLFYLGWDDHLYRMFSVFLDPNFAGAFFVLYFLYVLGFFFQEFFGKKDKIASAKHFTVLCFTFIALYLTHSRSALIMFLVGTFIFLAIIGKKKVMGIILTVTILSLLLSAPFFYIENINIFRIVSTEERIKSAQDALAIIKDNPILGIGYNAYRYAQIRYGFRGGEGVKVSHADAGTDNSFLFVLATTGVVGFVAYLYLWKKIIYAVAGKQFLNLHSRSVALNPNREWKGKYLPHVVISSIIAVFVDSFFINSLFYPFIIVWIFVLVGLNENR